MANEKVLFILDPSLNAMRFRQARDLPSYRHPVQGLEQPGSTFLLVLSTPSNGNTIGV
jgi:hypothetical protein